MRSNVFEVTDHDDSDESNIGDITKQDAQMLLQE